MLYFKLSRQKYASCAVRIDDELD